MSSGLSSAEIERLRVELEIAKMKLRNEEIIRQRQELINSYQNQASQSLYGQISPLSQTATGSNINSDQQIYKEIYNQIHGRDEKKKIVPNKKLTNMLGKIL